MVPFAYYFVMLFGVQPVVEYFAHRFLHIIKSKAHIDHHVKHVRKYDGYTCALYPAVISFCGAWFLPQLMVVWVGIAKYQITHYLVHNTDLFQELKRHHIGHHCIDPTKNYGFSAIWVDDVMGTRL